MTDEEVGEEIHKAKSTDRSPKAIRGSDGTGSLRATGAGFFCVQPANHILTMRHTSFTAIVGCLLVLTISLFKTEAKVFTHCELAQELRRLQIPETQIPIWVCIAHYESRLNSSAISYTGDHGIFQISEEYWCSPPGRGKECASTCAEFEDDDISDDVECIQTIFEEHKGISGNGFNAWAVYPRCRKSSTVNRFLNKCFSGGVDNSIDSVDNQIDIRGGNPTYFGAPPQNSLFIKKNYIQDHNFQPTYRPTQTFSRQSYNAIKDYSTPSFSAIQDVSRPSYQQDYSHKPNYSFTRTTASPFSNGYDYFSKSSSFSSSARKPVQIDSSSIAPLSSTSLSYSPSIYSPSRPSSYSIGSVYYNPFETKSPTSPPELYSFTGSLQKSYSSSIFGNSRTSSFDKSRTSFGFKTSPAPQVYKPYIQLGDAVVKTSSPAPTLKFKPAWADFPWWNGGK